MSNELQQIKASVAKLSIAVESKSIAHHPPMLLIVPNSPTTQSPPLTLRQQFVAWNCRGLSSGLPYAETLTEHADVLILSEH